MPSGSEAVASIVIVAGAMKDVLLVGEEILTAGGWLRGSACCSIPADR